MFHRAAAAFQAVARQSEHGRHAGIPTTIVVPEASRLEVMRNEGALFVIRGCPEIGDPLR